VLNIVNFGNAHSIYFSKLDGRNDFSGKHPYVIILKWVLDAISVHMGNLVDRVALELNILREIRLLFLVIIPTIPPLLTSFITDSAQTKWLTASLNKALQISR
jgi:hypothetical protein